MQRLIYFPAKRGTSDYRDKLGVVIVIVYSPLQQIGDICNYLSDET